MTALIEKACLIVHRHPGEILLFRHPTAGTQLVKGTINPGELPATAARRELAAESGLTPTSALKPLGSSTDIYPGQNWHLFSCTAPNAPDTWQHQTSDDHGQIFSFFWHPITAPLPINTAPRYRRALAFTATQ